MGIRVSARELRDLSVEQQVLTLLRAFKLAKESPVNGEITELEAEITTFEEQYHCRSSDLPGRLQARTLREDHGVCEWLMLIDRRQRLQDVARRVR